MGAKVMKIAMQNKSLPKRNHAGVIITDCTINVHINRLRKKLGPYANNIVSRTGYGYMFEANE